MKQISILIFCTMIYANIRASDCFIDTFNSNYANNYDSTDVFFIKGVKLKTVYHGMQIKILEDLKQNLHADTIMVWCSDGNSFRVEYSTSFNDADTLYMLVTKTDLEGNSPGDLNEIPDDLEKPDDYMPIHCAFSILKYSNDFITGRITSIKQDTTITLSDFFNQLPTGFNLRHSERIIKLFPNPVYSELFIQPNTNTKEAYTLGIYSVKGELVKTECLEMGNTLHRIDTSSLRNGIYILRLISASGKYDEKVIVKE